MLKLQIRIEHACSSVRGFVAQAEDARIITQLGNYSASCEPSLVTSRHASDNDLNATIAQLSDSVLATQVDTLFDDKKSQAEKSLQAAGNPTRPLLASPELSAPPVLYVPEGRFTHQSAVTSALMEEKKAKALKSI